MKFSFKYVGGATWILRVGAVKIACDPVLCPAGTVQDYLWFKSKRMIEPVFDESDFEDVDLWLVTHNHEDHLDLAGADRVHSKSVAVTHTNAISTLWQTGSTDVRPLKHGEWTDFSIKGMNIRVEAIPAVHGVNPVSAWLAGGVNGYWMTVSDGDEQRSIYIPGDTVIKRRVLTALRDRKADLLIANVGAAKKGSWIGTLTLSASMLKRLMKLLDPAVTIPVHFGTFAHYAEPIDVIQSWNDEAVRILSPGETVRFDLGR
jgi:N-acyl-phosphatidylethanolamine-hydrolysing phospholipase D